MRGTVVDYGNLEGQMSKGSTSKRGGFPLHCYRVKWREGGKTESPSPSKMGHPVHQSGSNQESDTLQRAELGSLGSNNSQVIRKTETKEKKDIAETRGIHHSKGSLLLPAPNPGQLEKSWPGFTEWQRSLGNKTSRASRKAI